MTQHHEPTRWLDDPALADDLRRELTDYANEGPSLARRARMFSGLEGELGLEAALTEQTAAVATRSLGKLKLWLGSAAVLAGSVGLFALWSMHAAPPVLPSVRTPLIVQPASHREELLAPTPTQELALAPVAPIVDEPAAPTAPRAHLKTRRVRERAPLVAPVPTAPPQQQPQQLHDDDYAKTSTLSDPVAELALLAQARRALLSKPAHALEFTEAHARKYPQGTFGEEREVLAIESLLRLGLDDEAKQRATAFEHKFPSSPHRAHLTRMMQSLQ